MSEGRKDNEDYEEVAKRANYEEVGLKNISEIIKLGEGVYSHYRHPIKNINRIAITQGMLIVVDSEEVGARHLEAHEEDSKLIWVDADQILEKFDIKTRNAQHWVEVLKRGVSYCIEQGWDKRSKKKKYLTEQFCEYGRLVNSGEYNGLSSEEAKNKMIEKLEKKDVGELTKMTKLHDWSVSRQRFWGAPVPMMYKALSDEEIKLNELYKSSLS